MKHNYKMQVEICTIEGYLAEMGCTQEDMYDMYGKYVKCFVWALMHDERVDYYSRLWAPVYVDTLVGYAQAMNTVTLDLLQEYEEYLRKAERK